MLGYEDEFGLICVEVGGEMYVFMVCVDFVEGGEVVYV